MKTLTQIVNSGKRFLEIMLLSAALTASSFTAGCKILDESGDAMPPFTRMGISYNQIKPNISEATRTINTVHDRTAVADVGKDYDNYKFIIGIEPSIGFEIDPFYLRLKTGADGSYSLDSEEQEYKKEQLPPSSISWDKYYSYAKFRSPSQFSFEPFIGLDAFLGPVLLGVECGFPYGHCDFEKGYNFGYENYSPIEKSSWKGFGKSLTGKIGFISENVIINLTYKQEQYEPMILNNREKVNISSFSLIFENKF